VRGSAWTAALKDVMILGVAVAIGLYLPWHYFGGLQPMFEQLERARPGLLTLAPAGMSPAWLVSTVILTALGFYMWPHYFAGSYTARDENVFRKNAVFLPLYQLVILFVFFVGFAAALVVPGLVGADADLSLFRIAKQTFGPWTVGMIGAAGLLTALVPGSMILVTAGTILAQNVFRALLPAAGDRAVSVLARSLVPVVTLLAVWLTLRGGQAIVSLLLVGYSLVTQLFPACVACLGRRPWASPAGAFAGILAGEATVLYMSVTNGSVAALAPSAPQAVKDLNVGVVALAVNVAVLALVTLATRRAADARATTATTAAAAASRSA
jgi:SSS family solute:Na+ symporter